MTHLYRMHDVSPAGVFPVADKAEARRWNEQGFGIFWTVNSFHGERRKENLEKIVSWAIDLDAGSKREQRERILRSPIVPSLVVETKNGFHVYWLAKGARAEAWNAIVLERLVPYFGADRNARDLCRILRVPGFLHLKDPKEPFLVRVAWQHAVAYTEQQIAQAFAWVPDKAAQRAAHDESRRAAEVEIREQERAEQRASGVVPTETLWEAIYRLDCEEGLRRLSGHSAVNGERYQLRRTGKGNLNVFVDSGHGWKSSPCFVDQDKRIGSPSGGGPTLVQWLRWFGHSWRVVLDTLFDLFPQLKDVDKQERARFAAEQKGAA